MTLKKPTGEIDMKKAIALTTAVAAAISAGGGAVGGQVSNAKAANIEARVAQLEACRIDTEARLRSMEAVLNRTDAGVAILLAAHKLKESK